MALWQSSLTEALPKRAIVMARVSKNVSKDIDESNSPKVIFIAPRLFDPLSSDFNPLSLDYSPAEDSSPKEPPCSQTESPAFELFQKMIGAMGLKLCEVAIFSSLSEIKESLHVPVVVVMGEKTAQDLLKTHASFNELRGHFQTVLTPSGSRNILLTYHPFELIQNPSLKKAAWEDLQQVMKLLN